MKGVTEPEVTYAIDTCEISSCSTVVKARFTERRRPVIFILSEVGFAGKKEAECSQFIGSR